jgi:hypothetical protein
MTTLEALIAGNASTPSQPGLSPRTFLLETIASEIDRTALGNINDCVEMAKALSAVLAVAAERLGEHAVDWRRAS